MRLILLCYEKSWILLKLFQRSFLLSSETMKIDNEKLFLEKSDLVQDKTSSQSLLIRMHQRPQKNDL